MALLENASTPAVARSATGTTGTTLTTASFSPPAGSVLLIAAQTMLRGTFRGSPTITVSTGASVSIVPLSFGRETSAGSAYGGFWYAYAATAPGAITVTMTRSESGAGSMQLAVRVLTGAATVQGGATASVDPAAPATTAGQVSISPTALGSGIYALSNATNNGITVTAVSGTTVLDNFDDPSDGMTGVVGKRTALTTSTSPVTVGVSWNAAYYSLTQAVEVLAAAPVDSSAVAAAGVGAATVTGTTGLVVAAAGRVTAGVLGSHTAFSAVAATGRGTAATSPTVTAAVSATGAGAATVAGTVIPRPVPPPTAPVITTNIFRAGYAITYSADATLSGTPVAGATGLQPTGGTVTDTIKPGVRRTLALELAPDPGLYDRLTPYGTMLTVTAHVRQGSRVLVDVPMGVYRVKAEQVTAGGGKLAVTADDKWADIAAAKFLQPTNSTPGLFVTDQIVALMRGALGQHEPATVTATSQAVVGLLTWQQDRAQAIVDLATSIGAWCYFDRVGRFTVADIPTIGSNASWLVDASASGIMIGLDRTRSREHTFNVVKVSSSAAGSDAFPPQIIWDSDPTSPTYAGTDPNAGANVGPFGIATYFHDDPTVTTASDAMVVAQAILAQTVGLASQASITAVPNPNVDAFDVLDVLPPRERYDIVRVMERHIVDTVVHPLDPRQPQTITGRSTRSDAYT